MENLIERIDSWGRSTPERLAHVSGDRVLTYGELSRRSDAVAEYLAGILADDGSPVAVLGHKEPEMLIAFLGAVKAGHPYVPLDTVLPRQRVEMILETARAKVVLTPDELSRLPQVATTARKRDLRPDDPFYIIFTSGSTGEPKGVVITLACLTSFLDWMLYEQSLAEGEEVFLNQAPFSFDLSVMDLYLSLSTGGTLFSVTSEEIANPRQLFRRLASSGITVWVSTPSFARMCMVERGFGEEMLPMLRIFLFCGETLAPEVASELLGRFPEAQLWNTYGPTETTVATTSICVDHELLVRYPVLPVGYPKPDSEILLLDDAGRNVEPGERGEIVIAGPNVSPGYLGRPDLTAGAFFDLEGRRAYRTGDWGRFREGMLFFEGRRDSQIKLHGYRIEIGDVEANLQSLPGVRDAVVVPTEKNGSYESLSAYVILDSRQDGSDFEIAQALRARLAEHLPGYMLPKRFHFRDSFPMTANGKVDRRSLQEVPA